MPAPSRSFTAFTDGLFNGAFSVIRLPSHLQTHIWGRMYRMWDFIASRIAWSALYLLWERPAGSYQWGLLVDDIECDEAAMKQWFELNATFLFEGRHLEEWVRMSRNGIAWVSQLSMVLAIAHHGILPPLVSRHGKDGLAEVDSVGGIACLLLQVLALGQHVSYVLYTSANF